MTALISLKQRTYTEIEARYTCLHRKRELRARTIVDGRQTFITQCIRCGHTSSPVARKRAEALSGGARIPLYDERLEEQWRVKKSQEYEQVFKTLGTALEAEYQTYLRSSTWRERRKAVLARTSDRCELCRIADAVEVHHLTYIRLGQELLTDLLAVCTSCHEALHAA